MVDREKVIEHITDCVRIADCQINHNWVFVRVDILKDVLDLLKEQEPLTPVQDGCGALICGNQTLGCGVVGMYDVATGKVTEKISNYCAFCGRKVKWND